MTDRELLGSVAMHTSIKVLKFVVALILPLLLVWAGSGFILWNWNPADWTENSRAASVFCVLMLTIITIAFAGDSE